MLGYLDYCQTNVHAVWLQEQSLCCSLGRSFFELWKKDNSFWEVALFIEKKQNKAEMRNLKRRQCSVCFILKWRNDKIFQSVTAAFIRELIQLSIQFTKVLWSSNKTTKEKTEIFFWGGGAHGNDETLLKIKHFERGISKMLKKSNFIFVFEPCLFLRKFL